MVPTIVTGGSGFLGRKLLEELESTTVLSRTAAHTAKLPQHVGTEFWKPLDEVDPALFEGVGAVIHLAGAGIADSRWTKVRKQQLWDSRVSVTRNLVTALSKVAVRPKALVSASAVGFYGNRGEAELTEQLGAGDGFLPAALSEITGKGITA